MCVWVPRPLKGSKWFSVQKVKSFCLEWADSIKIVDRKTKEWNRERPLSKNKSFKSYLPKARKEDVTSRYLVEANKQEHSKDGEGSHVAGHSRFCKLSLYRVTMDTEKRKKVRTISVDTRKEEVVTKKCSRLTTQCLQSRLFIYSNNGNRKINITLIPYLL